MEKILVAVDGSVHSLRAVQHAARLMHDAPKRALHVVHVEEEVPMRSHAFMSQEEIDRMYRKQAQERCANVLEYLKQQGVSYQWHLVVGDPAEKIVHTATSLGADIVIIGSHGLGAVSSLVLGSVVLKIVEDAPMPVTVVK